METNRTSRVTPLRELSPELLRTPPYNPEAEARLLGALLINNSVYHRVSEFLQDHHFGNALHSRIFSAIGKLIERGQIANPITLKNMFDQDAALTEVGGAQYLVKLAQAAVAIIDAQDYARAVHDLHLRRELITVGEDIVNSAFRHDLDDPAREQIERAEKKLFDLATTGEAEGGFRVLAAALTGAIHNAQAAFKRDGKTVGTATGFAQLDGKLGGLHRSDLVILAGRPGMGKTSLATNIAFNAAKAYRPGRAADGQTIAEDGGVVGFFSLEMSSEQLATRMLAEESGVASDRIRRGSVKSEDFDKFIQASRRLESVPLFIDDTPALTVSAMRTRARRLKRQQGLGLIVVDHIQLLRPSTQARVIENRVQELSEITRSLKALAKELDVPVLALSQLSRAVEQREDKRPMLSDLRESGSIEQDADVVMFLFRQDYYDGREPKKNSGESDDAFRTRFTQWQEHMSKIHGVAELLIAKQRHGPIGEIKLYFNPETTKFETYADPEHLPSADF
jgi:replicative DNA helicase